MSDSGSIDGVFREIRDEIDRFRHPDIRPLVDRVRQDIIDGNRNGLLAGLDADGRAFAPIAPSTRERAGHDQPFAQALIDRFRAQVEPDGEGGFTIAAGWEDFPQLQFFRSGTSRMPARNPCGIRPDTLAAIDDTINAFCSNLIHPDVD